MANSLLRLFGKLRKNDPNHADDGFQKTAIGQKIRIERRMSDRRLCAERRLQNRAENIDRRVNGLERRLGVDWRAWIE